MQVFEYVVLVKPTEDEKKAGKVAEIIVPITPCLAKDSNQATMLAGRAIPESYLDQLDRVEVAVRPF